MLAVFQGFKHFCSYVFVSLFCLDLFLLCRFDGVDFLRRLKGKKLMFVGDSLSLNQWQSLSCMLFAQVPNAKYNLVRGDGLATLTFLVCFPFFS